MRALPFLLFAAAAAAQPNGDARNLLADVTAAMRDLKSWRATGTLTIEVDMGGRVTKTESAFTMTKAPPNLMRLDVTGSPPAISIVCDGPSLWVSLSDPRRHNQLSDGGNPRCLPAAPWPDLLKDAGAISSQGSGAVEMGGKAVACELVQVTLSKIPVIANVNGRIRWPKDGEGTRTLCIDRRQRSVLRDELRAVFPSVEIAPGAAQLVATTTYTTFERNPDLPRDLFRFEPPAGSEEQCSALVPQPGMLAAGPLFVDNDAGTRTSPVAIHKVAPHDPEEAGHKKIEGTVTLSLVIDADGVPQRIHVIRSLDPDHDKEAIKAISAWRFQPARRDGKPVEACANTEVTFRHH